MKMSRKDLIFIIFIIIMFCSGLLSTIYGGEKTLVISNMIWVFLLGILTCFKIVNKKFGLWLEKPLKNK